jgi:hypothetical protein
MGTEKDVAVGRKNERAKKGMRKKGGNERKYLGEIMQSR